MLNMGYRLHVVHRLLKGQHEWPGWQDWRTFLVDGVLATLVILIFHMPTMIFVALSLVSSGKLSILFLVVGVLLLVGALYILPGFMTFYARDFDRQILTNPSQALRRVRKNRYYNKAWAIGFVASGLSLVGLLFAGIGFAWTSVWFWQVAAYCFSSSFVQSNALER